MKRWKNKIFKAIDTILTVFILTYILLCIIGLIICIAQKAIVHFSGNDCTYIVNEETAYIYEEPDSYSDVIANSLYDEKVTKIQDEKMWLKVEYETQDGETVTGWMKKIDLMTYLEYEFGDR